MAFPALQRMAVRRLLSLPGPVLRLASGGVATYRAGRTLDVRLQALAAAGAPAVADLSPADAREACARWLGRLRPPPEPGVRSEPLTLPLQECELRARAYRPQDQDPGAPALVFAHGGGGVLGDLDTADGICAILARGLRAPVLSLDYRLAPEHRFPAGLEDMLAACRWARDNAARLGAPPDQLMVGGEGVGAGFAATTCQVFRRSGEPQPALQILFYPWTDIVSETSSMNDFADAFPLSRATLAWLAGQYLGPHDDPGDPRASPLRAESFDGLAPAAVATAGFDPLLDQGEAYALRLRDAGAPLAYRCYETLTHDFAAFAGVVPAADAACREMAGLARGLLDARAG